MYCLVKQRQNICDVCFTSQLKLRNETEIITYSNHLLEYTLHWIRFYPQVHTAALKTCWVSEVLQKRISPIDFTGVAVRCFTTSAVYAQRQLTTGVYYVLITSPVLRQYSCFMYLKI